MMFIYSVPSLKLTSRLNYLDFALNASPVFVIAFKQDIGKRFKIIFELCKQKHIDIDLVGLSK